MRIKEQETCLTLQEHHDDDDDDDKVSTQWDPTSFTVKVKGLLIYMITVYFNVLVINSNFIIDYFNFYCKRNGAPLSAHLIYLKNILYGPEDDRLRSKHVTIM